MNKFWKKVYETKTCDVNVIESHLYGIDIPLSSFMAEMFVYVSLSDDSKVQLPFTSAITTENMLISKISDPIIESNLKKLGLKESVQFNRNMTLSVDDFEDKISYMACISYLKALYSIHRKVNFNEYLSIKSELTMPMLIKYQTILMSDSLIFNAGQKWKKWAVIEAKNNDDDENVIRYETDMFQPETNMIIEVKTSYQENEELSECKKISVLNETTGQHYSELLVFMKPFKVFKIG